MSLTKRSTAEFLGTLWLVFGGCGSAVLAAAVPNLGIGYLGVALAFGLTVLTMAYAIGHISGCHLNPAVTIGLWTGKRIPASDILPYIVAQVLGGITGAGLLYVIASGKAGFSLTGGFAANFHVSDDHPRLNRHARAKGTGAAGHRIWTNADSSDQHSRDEHVSESGAQHRAGAVRRRLGNSAVVAFLGGADRGRGPGGTYLFVLCRRNNNRADNATDN